MNAKTTMLTATEEGLAKFLMELKRVQVVSQVREGIDKLSPRSKSGKKWHSLTEKERTKLLLAQSDRYLADWEKQKVAHIEKTRKDRDAETVKKYGTSSIMGEALLGLSSLAEDHHKDRIHSISTYIGELNRDISKSRVSEYAKVMSDGDWWFTPDPIVITDKGYIINGQHRLLAAEPGLPPKVAPTFVVVWGVDKTAALLMDEARRSNDDRRSIAIRYAQAGSA